MKHQVLPIMLAAVTLAISGCATICDEVIETEMCARNAILSQKAWGHWSWCYEDLDFPMHFARGFKAGYRNVLDGGSGCQPTLPPQCYWKPCFQTPEGQCKTHAWFDGFSHGALAAKQDGYGSLGEIPISPRVRENLRLANSRPNQTMYYATEAGADTTMPLLNSGDPGELTSPPEIIETPGVLDPITTPPGSGRPYDE